MHRCNFIPQQNAIWSLMLRTLLVVGIGLMCSSCRKYVPPPAPCNIDTLFVDASIIPEPLVGPGGETPSARYGVEFQQIFYIHPREWDGGKVRQVIYRAENETRATRGYNDFVDTYFYPGKSFHCDDDETVWVVPTEITFESQSADDWRLGCTMGCTTHVQRCQYIGRYGVYFVWYYTWMSDIVTYAEFETILEDIDSRMTMCLEQAGYE